MAPSLGPLITPLKYTDYTAPKSITNVVGGAIVARSPGTTPRPQEDTEAPGRDQYPSAPQDPSRTPRPQQDTNTPARPKNLARNKVLTRSVRQVGPETSCFTQLRKSSLELVGFVTGLGARNRANLAWDNVLKGCVRKVVSNTWFFIRFLSSAGRCSRKPANVRVNPKRGLGLICVHRKMQKHCVLHGFYAFR